ncbi:MAG TPA: hypothetical protein VMJ31_09950 [Methylocystis sp.]|nr:hypothetical protein [Methylocystis sp.]
MIRSSNAARVAVAALALSLGAGLTAASAETWAQAHPRRAQVNGRLAHQNARINTELKEGEITRGQARALHRQDRAVRQEERDMASQNGGHITPADQRVLNQQENGISREIGR